MIDAFLSTKTDVLARIQDHYSKGSEPNLETIKRDYIKIINGDEREEVKEGVRCAYAWFIVILNGGNYKTVRVANDLLEL